MSRPANGRSWKTILAFAAIYFLWGGSFLAIRVGVQEVPPLLFAAIRFTTAGLILYCWALSRRQASPTRQQWASVSLLAFLIFVLDYGCLFWAEQRVASGVAAVMLAMIPAFTALSEIVLLGTQRLTLRLALALAIGVAGVAVLMSRSLDLGGAPVDPLGAAALIFAALSWSVASALSRKVPLPDSKIMSSGAQMLLGGGFLGIAAASLGQLGGFHPAAVSVKAWVALLYLIVPGIDHRIHRVCLADPARVAHQGGDLCLRQSGGGGAVGPLPGGGGARPENSCWERSACWSACW